LMLVREGAASGIHIDHGHEWNLLGSRARWSTGD
jgi:hypothetical protein